MATYRNIDHFIQSCMGEIYTDLVESIGEPGARQVAEFAMNQYWEGYNEGMADANVRFNLEREKQRFNPNLLVELKKVNQQTWGGVEIQPNRPYVEK